MKKLFAVFISIMMLMLSPSNVFAEALLCDDVSTQVTILDDSTSSDDIISPLSETSGIINNAVYRIKNVGSGKYMNVHYGVDANGTNVYQWTADGSQEQNFKVIYSSATDSYRLYAMCSSNGGNRVINAARNGADLTHGQNVNIWVPVDATAQELRLIALGQNQYRIGFKAHYNLYIAAFGNTNGTSGGTSSSSAGNIYISDYVGEMYQHWMFELVSQPTVSAPTGYLESVSASSISGWAQNPNDPSVSISVHIYIRKTSNNEVVSVIPVVANNYRSDVGNHGFNYSIDWRAYPPTQYQIEVYAICNGNPQISNSPKYFTVRACDGCVDYGNSSGVYGWMWKPDAPNYPISAHIYIRKSDNTQVYSAITSADIYRSDLANLGYGNGNHGYSFSIPWSTLPKEELTAYVYAVDGSGSNPLIGYVNYNNADPHGEITLYGIKHEDTDARKNYYTSDVYNACQAIGTTGLNAIITGVTASTALTQMRTSMIWTVHTHGSPTAVFFTHPTAGDTSLTYWDIEDLPDNALSSERCVIYGTCNAGQGGSSADNMVTITAEKGAMTVIGWQNETYVSQMNLWLSSFLIHSGAGNTVDASIKYADDVVETRFDGNMGGLGDANILVAGSITQKLVS